jgi:hypothetical protein
MDAAVSALGKGCRVWYRASDTSWQLADIKDKTAAGNYDIVLLASGKPEQNIDHTKLVPANPDIQAAIEDLTQLSYLNEPSILHDLWERYQKDSVYTNAGPVLIAVNPCKTLPLYTAEVAQQYKSEFGHTSSDSSRRGASARCLLNSSWGRSRGGGHPAIKLSWVAPAAANRVCAVYSSFSRSASTHASRVTLSCDDLSS